ncbi:PREDICTED: uncharacterized protein LOC105568703 [Vollenhovia emeryi]|uniref:uncharacterized protein LOC105568703 n=1 Tax=Vollenhovia emeryi TaxID=411798 RepID=UPI0005F3C567|nr:PREDICTED: uncharacterized protein LOC105568703 [Vollenhovia emeryi]
MSNKTTLDDVRKILLACLVSRKGATSLTCLDRDYYEQEQQRVPYRRLGYSTLVDFLRSMPEHFVVEEHNGQNYVHAIASEKSKHVSSLVERQISKRFPRTRQYALAPFNRRVQYNRSQEAKIAPDKLLRLVQHIRNNPNGVSLQSAVAFVNDDSSINISSQELRTQLLTQMHQLLLDGNMIYHKSKDLSYQPVIQNSLYDLESPPTRQTECAAGEESDYVQYCNVDNGFVPANYANSSQRRAEKTKKQFMKFSQYDNCEDVDMSNYMKRSSESNDDFTVNSKSTMGMKTDEYCDLSTLINDKTKSRLEELMQRHPEGILCADLPNVFFNMYKMRLNYTVMGFASVREFTSYLPQIFYMTQINKNDDFMLYSADKRPIVPKTDPIDIMPNRYDKQAQYSNNNNVDDAPIPAEISPTITKSFAPNDVMNYGDKIGKIPVTELQQKSFLEVYVVEVFHPNFFWIHLRRNRTDFYEMMDKLTDFYEEKKNTYIIAKVALKKDMNCACIYVNRWHRGIIKSVKPDFRVTVFFYDYGTLKTYAAEDVYYLHKSFSSLPAQAIPCCLHNVTPIVGDRWKKSAVDQFIDKIADTLLAATVITVDPTHNSMMVILTDTTEDEDVIINNWLVKQRLAQVGQMVRINEIYFMTPDNIKPSTSKRIIHKEDIRMINSENYPRHKYQSISCNDRTPRLSDVKSEDIERNTVKSLHNVPTSKKALLQMLCSRSPDAKSLDAKSSDAKSLDAKISDAKSPDTEAAGSKSQLRNYRKEGLRTSRKLLLEKLQTLNPRAKNFNLSTSTSDTNSDNEGARINANGKINSQNNSEDCGWHMNFDPRDSDNENDTNDFGTFRSLYGGRGLMEPVDWSAIRNEKILPHKTTASELNENLDTSITSCESNVEDKSELHNERELPGKQYFLNITSKQKEIFLPENNIDHDIENTSDFIEALKESRQQPDHIVTVMIAPNNTLKELHNGTQLENASNSNTNLVKSNVASSKEIDQKVNRNGKMCETRPEQKIENTNFNTDSKSVIPNISNSKDNINKEVSECNTNNCLESNADKKVYRSTFKTLLDKLSRKRVDSMNSSFVNANESSSSDHIPSSSYSSNTSDDTIISSSDEPSKTSNCSDTNGRIEIIKKLKSTSEESPKNRTLDESHSNFGGTTIPSTEIDFIASPNVDDARRRLNQSSQSDSNFIASSCNVDDSNQLKTTNQTALGAPKFMQQMLKMIQSIDNNSEFLDSDDLSSNDESINDDISDESKGDIESVKSSTCNSTDGDVNVTENAFASPVFNDCDIESDDESSESERMLMQELNKMFLFTSRNKPPKQTMQITDVSNDLADAVDMASIMKYVQNNLNQLPTYCFAEENLMPDNCCKATSAKQPTEEKHEVPVVSPGPTHLHYDNHHQQHSVRPPPGFPPLSEHVSPNLSATNLYGCSFENIPVLNAQASGFSDAEATTNPFLVDQQFSPNDVAKQMYMTVWNENKKLQIQLTRILEDLLEHSSFSFNDQIQLNKILKIVEQALLEQKEDHSVVTNTSSTTDTTSGTTSNDVGPAQEYILKSETFPKQDINANTFSTTNPFGTNNDDRPQNNIAFPTYNSDSFATAKSNWNQSNELNSSSTSRMQMPPSTIANSVSSMFVNPVPSTSTFLPSTNRNGENVPETPVSSTVPTTNLYNDFSHFLESINNQFTNMLKDTNPFKFSMTDGMQVPETQNEQTSHKYDMSGASYLTVTNPQSHSSKTETPNIHSKSNCFTPAGHLDRNYTSRIVYESGPVMYNTQKKKADVDAKQNTRKSNSDNIQNTQSLELGQDKKPASQPAKDIATSYTQHMINHIKRDNSQAENYVTQPPTYYTQGSQPVVNGESAYYQQNVNNFQPVSSQAWIQNEVSEHWINSKLQNNVPMSNHSVYSTPTTLSHQDWNCDTGRKSIPREMNEATESSFNFTFKDNRDKEGPMYSCTNSWKNIETGPAQQWNAASSFVFRKIDTVKGVTLIFNFAHDGWILTYEFVEAFTNFKLQSRLLAVLEAMNIKVVFKEIQRSEYPAEFSQLDRYPLKVPRDSEKRIISINLISLQTALTLLRKLKIISFEEIDNAFKKNEFLDSSILPTLWILFVTYRDLRQHVELNSNHIV